GGFVRADLLLAFVWTPGRAPSRPAFFGAEVSAPAPPRTAEITAAAGAAAGAGIGARQHCQHPLDRAAGRKLHNHERDEQDPEQRRDHQEQPSKNVGAHLRSFLSPPPNFDTATLEDLRCFVGVVPPGLWIAAV